MSSTGSQQALRNFAGGRVASRRATILIYRSHAPSPFRHGGVRRSQQIAEDLTELGYEAVPISIPTGGGSLLTKIEGSLWAARVAARGFRLRQVAGAVARAGRLAEILRKANPRVLIIENTACPFVVSVARACGVARVIAMPHNLEVFNTADGRAFGRGGLTTRLGREVFALGESDACFAISEEESWLLRACGVNCVWYPYGCDRTTLEDAVRIRKMRAGGHSSRVLVAGSKQKVHEAAMADLVQFLESHRIPAWLCGHGQHGAGENFVESFGTVDDGHLARLMAECRALIVHQNVGSGALTRIVDTVSAGVPVVCSRHAARSTFGLAGVVVYDDLMELPDCLRAADSVCEVGETAQRAAVRQAAVRALKHQIHSVL